MDKPNFPLGNDRVATCLLMDEEEGFQVAFIAQASILWAASRESSVISIADAMDAAWTYYNPNTPQEAWQMSFLIGMNYALMGYASSIVLAGFAHAVAAMAEQPLSEIPQDKFMKLAVAFFTNYSSDGMKKVKDIKSGEDILGSIFNNKNNEEDEQEHSVE